MKVKKFGCYWNSIKCRPQWEYQMSGDVRGKVTLANVS